MTYLHGEVATSSVSIDGMSLSSFDKEIVNHGRRSKHVTRSVCGKSEDKDNDEDHHCMHIVGQECGLDTTEHGVQNDTNRQ